MKKAFQISIGANVAFILFATIFGQFVFGQELSERDTNDVKEKLEDISTAIREGNADEAQMLVEEASEIIALEEKEQADEENSEENNIP